MLTWLRRKTLGGDCLEPIIINGEKPCVRNILDAGEDVYAIYYVTKQDTDDLIYQA
jgi:hypothetical protein